MGRHESSDDDAVQDSSSHRKSRRSRSLESSNQSRMRTTSRRSNRRRRSSDDSGSDSRSDRDSASSDSAHERKSRRRSRTNGSSSSSKRKRRHRQHRRRSRSSSSVSSGSNASSSSEDEAQRRKKLRKQKKRAEKMLASFGYSNDTNPFGDSNLSQPFVWSKKFEHNKKQLPSAKELKRQQEQRIEEIRKARERRDAREAEREEMERLKQEEMRLRDAEQYEDWQTKEEEFHLNQTKVRSKLRIAEQREKPVDLLAKNYLLVSDLLNEEEEKEFFDRQVLVEKREPYEIVNRLALYELEELKENIKAYQELETKQQEQRGGSGETLTGEFWKLMMLICCDRIRQFKRHASQRQANGQEMDESAMRDANAIHSSVQKQILAMLEGKTLSQLRDLKYEVEKTIESAATTSGVDVEYWEEVAQQIEVFEARTRLKQLHEEMLDKLADRIQAHDDQKESEYRRRREQSPNDGLPSGIDDSVEAREMQQLEESKGLEASEERMEAAEEVDVEDSSSTKWSEKYQPRKPRYFNRVKTGYDWNKYNQTHYDHDNPPPKVVQGYKFNLFYPDLIDKTKAPRFFLEKANHPDFCILRFHAGPPYHDIAFKIVNREWEYSHKRGFKSVFERGILHLYFNFKRHRYRR